MFQSLSIRHKKSFVYLYSNYRYSKLTTCVCLSTFHKLTFCIFFGHTISRAHYTVWEHKKVQQHNALWP